MGEHLEQYSRGVEAIREKRFDEGIRLLKPLIESAELDFARKEHSRMLVGYAHANKDEWEQSIEYFKAAMLNDIKCMPARTALGHAYIMTTRYDEALEIFRTAVQLEPGNPQAHHGLGWALLEQEKDLDEALYQVQEASRLDPKSAAIRDSLGWILYRMGDLEAADEQLEKAVELEPDHPVILEHRREIKDALKKKGIVHE